jgi:toxin ParE1/3/4
MDLINIGRYTYNRWGKQQRNKYLRNLDEQFHRLAENPHLGRHRSDIHEGYYSFAQGLHLIFYIIHDNGIDIIGVPHSHMDIQNFFAD